MRLLRPPAFAGVLAMTETSFLAMTNKIICSKLMI